MKKYFFTGFITLLPIMVTIMIVIWLFNLLTDPFVGFTEWIIVHYEAQFGLSLKYHHSWVAVLSKIFAVIVLILLTFLLGVLSQKFLNKYLTRFLDLIFSRIPIIKTIYSLSRDVIKATFTNTQKAFKETVLVPFPHQESLAIGFVTGETHDAFKHEKYLTELAVFVPTSPHPMSGFILLMPKNVALPVDVSVQDAFRFIISAGVLHPGDKTPSEEQKN
jgi:uncharacterized membrane protein